MADDEVHLEGGNVTAGVVRVGATVRRPRKPTSPLAEAVLRHLEAVGFVHAPRFLGVDEQGRDVLSFAPGRTIWPHVPELLADGSALEPIGALVRAYHDAMASFPSPVDDGSIVLHNDLAPWNVVLGDDGAWTLIDWDGVAQGRPAWELAYVLHTFVPLWSDAPFADDDEEVVRRITRLMGAYGADAALTADALQLVPDRCHRLADLTEQYAAEGDPSFRSLVEDGHPQLWRDAAAHVGARLPRWLGLLRER